MFWLRILCIKTHSILVQSANNWISLLYISLQASFFGGEGFAFGTVLSAFDNRNGEWLIDALVLKPIGDVKFDEELSLELDRGLKGGTTSEPRFST